MIRNTVILLSLIEFSVACNPPSPVSFGTPSFQTPQQPAVAFPQPNYVQTQPVASGLPAQVVPASPFQIGSSYPRNKRNVPDEITANNETEHSKNASQETTTVGIIQPDQEIEEHLKNATAETTLPVSSTNGGSEEKLNNATSVAKPADEGLENMKNTTNALETSEIAPDVVNSAQEYSKNVTFEITPIANLTKLKLFIHIEQLLETGPPKV